MPPAVLRSCHDSTSGTPRIGSLPAVPQILRGMKRLRRHWGDFTLPLYVHHGEADK